MLRVLTEKDLPQLVAIEAATQAVPWSEEIFKKCFQLDGRGWAIDVNGNMIGFILIVTQADECHILNLCIEPLYQQQGYGKQLLLHVLNEIKQQRTEIVYLEVRRSNQKAIFLYEKMGFQIIGERKNYYSLAEGQEDALVFAKDLSK
jgi:ribosomal-protein-alanine N-acetyltransferase